MRLALRISSLLPILCVLCHAAVAEDGWQGRPVTELLNHLNAGGYQIIFSSDVVSSDMRLESEPDLADPFSGLNAVLAPLGLQLLQGPANAWLIRQREVVAPAAVPAAKVAPPLPEIIVTSSLHRLEYRQTGTNTYLDRELATRIPAAAEEAVRITTRLPGTAGGGISSRSHIRGGEVNEVLFLLDGHRLYEPYHLKDFQSVASIVNSGAIDGIDFYTGAYPARYGDRMSGVMNMSLREPVEAIETELSLSFFNASVVSLGRFGDSAQGDWLLAVRRGNLDLIADIIDPEIGSPDYQDYLLHGGWEFEPRLQLSANLLLSYDKIILNDPDRGEAASAYYRNKVGWLRWRADWSDRWQSDTVVSISKIENKRDGSVALPFIVAATLNESREFDAIGLKQDWTFVAAKNWMYSFGIEAKHQDAKYRFLSSKTVAPPFDQILDNMPVENRDFDLAPEGAQYSAYAEARWQPHPRITLDAGLRWDHQSYTTADDDEQSSPRFGVLFQAGERTELRLGWGQFSQAQEINEMQVSDGVSAFFRAQRAEHIVANLKHEFANSINVDVSYYRKSFRSVRPRFENAFNTLTLLPEIQFDRYRIDPVSAEATGAELLLSNGGADQAFFWWAGYAWAEVRDKTPEDTIPRSWDQAHTIKAGLSWRWHSWNFSAAGEAHTGWPKTEYPGANINALEYSDFHTLDVRVSRSFDVRRGELTAFLEVSNLYNRENPCCTEYSVVDTPAGQELVGDQGYWLPLIPSLGVVWRF